MIQQIESEYVKQGREFLERNGIEFRAVLIGSDCPRFCEDAAKQIDMDKIDDYPRKSHIHGKHYRCTFSAKGRGHISVDYWNSYSDEEFNALGSREYRLGESVFKYGKEKRTVNELIRTVQRGKRLPSGYDVLTCLTKDDPGTFENFCGDFGYDEDSRRAEETYRAVVDEWKRVRRFFTEAELNEAREIQ